MLNFDEISTNWGICYIILKQTVLPGIKVPINVLLRQSTWLVDGKSPTNLKMLSKKDKKSVIILILSVLYIKLKSFCFEFDHTFVVKVIF